MLALAAMSSETMASGLPRVIEGATARAGPKHHFWKVVPETEGIAAGISCKDFGKQNPNKWFRAKGSLLHSEKSPGKSCETF